MKYPISLSLLAATVLIACHPTGEPVSQEGISLGDYFDPEQVEELKTLIQHFDREICGNDCKSPQQIKTHYTKHFKQVYTTAQAGNLSVHFDTQALLAALSESTFHRIWHCTMGKEKNSRHVYPATYTSRPFIHLHPTGPYYEFLRDYASTSANSAVRQYWQDYSPTNSNTPTAVAHLLTAYDTLDYEQPATRLLVAIYYLSVEFNFHPINSAKLARCSAPAASPER